jgi:hypothetical protein
MTPGVRKGRIAGAKTITVTKNEIITALNKPDNFILAIVQVLPIEAAIAECQIRYVSKPFQNEPDFGQLARKLQFTGIVAARHPTELS